MNTIPVLPYPERIGVAVSATTNDAALLDAAKKLEATFLSEMLKDVGFDDFTKGFGGGVGQDQFASFLRDAQAEELVESGGIGLAEALFNAMKREAYDQ